MKDLFKQMESKHAYGCPLRCWELDSRHNWYRKQARRLARRDIRRMDEREWRQEEAA